jgi:hypothetical protein
MNYSELLHSWWLMPSVWAALSVVSWAALRCLQSRDEAPARQEPESPADAPAAPTLRFDRADSVTEIVGSYMGQPIYASVIIEGVRYEYERVLPSEHGQPLPEGARCIEPGIVYVRR